MQKCLTHKRFFSPSMVLKHIFFFQLISLLLVLFLLKDSKSRSRELVFPNSSVVLLQEGEQE